ncbi:MAG: cytochrome c-type biogenesis protein [Pseudomonadota bacterium]
MIGWLRSICVIALLWGAPSWALEPDELLADPVLEDRARSISGGLRCLQCRNESIDESNAQIARDLRLLVRERLVAGDSDTEVVDFVVARYGEYVLLRPNGTGMNIVLWGAGPGLLVLTLLALALMRRSKKSVVAGPLTDTEEQKLAQLLQRHPGSGDK